MAGKLRKWQKELRMANADDDGGSIAESPGTEKGVQGFPVSVNK